MRYLLALCLALWGTTTKAETITPQYLIDNYPLATIGGCTDSESGEEGKCFIFLAGDGYYLVFVQKDEPVFIRQVKPPNPYVEVWRAKLGVSL